MILPTPRARRVPPRAPPLLCHGWLCVLECATALFAGASAHAQTTRVATASECQAGVAGVVSDTSWSPPLDRRLSIEGGVVPLREALERVAAAANVRLSYSPELIPLTRAVCLRGGSESLGQALVATLSGTGVVPILVGGDQIVLAPSNNAATADAAPAMARTSGQLARVVVTGTATGGVERVSPFALTVRDGSSLMRTHTVSLSDVFDGAIAGVWMWNQSPASVLARYGSVRGASSFGVSAPKIYVDGIEVANPLLLTQLDPASIERVEVIRGPQGAALYGADAISGVVQIVTRHDGASAAGATTELRVGAGAAASAFADGGILRQEHGLMYRTGSAAHAASLGVTVSTLGAYVPDAYSRQVLATGSLRRVGTRLVVTGTGRLQATEAAAPLSPILRASLPASTPPNGAADQRVGHYTLGGTATFQASEHWTHAATAGIDGYRLSGFSTDGMLVPSATDSALRAASGGADRITLRTSSTRRFGDSETHGLSLSFGAEHSTAREHSTGIGDHLALRRDEGNEGPERGERARAPQPAAEDSWWSNSGVLTQAQVALGNTLFITGGARAEHMSGPTLSQVALLPMLGAAWVNDRGPVTLKLRAAYGRGIRPARTVMRGSTWMGGRVEGTLTALDPEQQKGWEGGLDALWGNRFEMYATRFEQRAAGLVQPVALLDTTTASGVPGPGPREGHVLYLLQNVGAIDNRGWELQSKATFDALTLGGTLSLVASRVARLASGYRGDLLPGDRMLEVPARTLGLNAGWTTARWSAALSVSRAEDWINYDRRSIAQSIAADSLHRAPVGQALRAFWRSYQGVTRLNAQLFVPLRGRTTLSLSGENLLNHQLGEPDDVTVLPGRSLLLGVRAVF